MYGAKRAGALWCAPFKRGEYLIFSHQLLDFEADQCPIRPSTTSLRDATAMGRSTHEQISMLLLPKLLSWHRKATPWVSPCVDGTVYSRVSADAGPRRVLLLTPCPRERQVPPRVQ